LILSFMFHGTCSSQADLEGRNLVKLESTNSVVVIDLGGGAMVDFHLKGQNLNPLSWNHPEKGDTAPREMGHFICLDRWGAGSKSEIANGMPWHGEASKSNWDVIVKPSNKNGKIFSEISCDLIMAGINVKRALSLDENESVMHVTESITNVNKLGRVYNIVQHATFGPPFLDESTVFDTKVQKGFAQGGKMPNPEEPVFYWPKAVVNGRLIDFRSLSADNQGPGVISFIVDNDDEYGWATACNASKELMIGYIWKISDYPWLNMWRNIQNGKPFSFGFEFGSTGLHQPFPVLIEKGTIFGRQLFEYIDAGETREKSYTAFLTKIPEDYKGVADIQFKDNLMTIEEHGDNGSRTITIKIN
ncbi:hypothetical protein ACFL50_07200, partial [Candidatus Latescibacterota bacterium]